MKICRFLTMFIIVYSILSYVKDTSKNNGQLLASDLDSEGKSDSESDQREGKSTAGELSFSYEYSEGEEQESTVSELLFSPEYSEEEKQNIESVEQELKNNQKKIKDLLPDFIDSLKSRTAKERLMSIFVIFGSWRTVRGEVNDQVWNQVLAQIEAQGGLVQGDIQEIRSQVYHQVWDQVWGHAGGDINTWLENKLLANACHHSGPRVEASSKDHAPVSVILPRLPFRSAHCIKTDSQNQSLNRSLVKLAIEYVNTVYQHRYLSDLKELQIEIPGEQPVAEDKCRGNHELPKGLLESATGYARTVYQSIIPILQENWQIPATQGYVNFAAFLLGSIPVPEKGNNNQSIEPWLQSLRAAQRSE